MRGDSGAVFVESIIAAAIVAMALGATLQVVADSAGRDRSAEAHQTALLVAQSELDEVGVNIPLETGRTFGEADEMAWRVDVSPYAAEGEPNSAGALWKVAVSVRSRHGGPDLVSLETLRLGGGS